MNNSSLICIIGAMECEIAKLKSLLKNIEEVKYRQFTFFKGELFGKNTVIAQSGVGKVAGAVCTQILIDKFNPELIINTGLAGGLGDNLSIGDVVIADKLVQHDFDTTCLGYAKGYICNGINPKEPTYFYADKKITEKFKNNEFDSKIKFHIGTIASGDVFISDDNKKNEIKKLFNAMAVEMEGASIAHCATLNDIPFVIARIVSDLAGDNATEGYVLIEEDIAKTSVDAIKTVLENI